MRRPTSLQTWLLLLKVLWSDELQQGVEERDVGKLADKDQGLETHTHTQFKIILQ